MLRPWMLLAFLLVVAARAAGAAEPAPLELSVLSYNVHGLPGWIAMDSPKRRMPRIAEHMAHYDVALVQEDWAYHSLLRKHSDLPFIARGNGPRSVLLAGFGPLCGACGSGLAIFSRAQKDAVLAVENGPYGRCSGWLSNGSDCFATKGYLMMRLRLSNGAEVDLYDIHLDAGRGAADQKVRVKQLEVLAKAIRSHSEGRAVIVGGDFNLAFDHPRKRAAVIEEFALPLGLADTSARPDRAQWRERIDYLLFRSGSGADLALLEAGHAKEFVHKDRPLSDHPAIYARFRVTPAPSVPTSRAADAR